MSEENIFEQASRENLRYECIHGIVNTEDLWDLGLDDLNTLYSSLYTKKDKRTKYSLKEDDNPEDNILNLKLKIVEHVYRTKDAERLEAENLVAEKAKKQRIMEIINKKKDEKLEALDIAELEKMLDN